MYVVITTHLKFVLLIVFSSTLWLHFTWEFLSFLSPPKSKYIYCTLLSNCNEDIMTQINQQFELVIVIETALYLGGGVEKGLLLWAHNLRALVCQKKYMRIFTQLKKLLAFNFAIYFLKSFFPMVLNFLK